MPQRRFLTLLLTLTLLPALASADVRLPKVFSDGAVLQRGRTVPVWGWADDGETVTVTVAGQSATAVAKDGRWRVDLPELPTGGPYELVVSGKNTLTVKDVLVGEVWFSAGQSNMMMSIANAENGEAALAKLGQYPNLRVAPASGEHCKSDAPSDDLPLAWRKPDSGYSAVSYFFATKLYDHFEGKVPVGMITVSLILPTEAWVDAPRIAADPSLRHLPNHPLKVASKAYNGTIAPLAPYALRGILYYQAEYNAGRYLEFRTLFPALIASWRDAWERADLPFLFVQLPGFQKHLANQDVKLDMDPRTLSALHEPGGAGQWALMRESQYLTHRTVPHTGMAVAIDLGDPWDIHPRRKEPVAERLLLQARKVAYGEKDLLATGPTPAKVAASDGAFVVHFDNVGKGLVVKGEELIGFDIAGPQLDFRRAQAKVAGETVVVSHPEVTDPAVLRYAWAGYPQGNLYNSADLPAMPFRHRVPGKVLPPSGAMVAVPNGGFEAAAKDGDSPEGWKMAGKGQWAQGSAAEGERSILAPAKGDGVSRDGISGQAGYAWNCDPLLVHALRAGSVLAWSVSIAAGEGEGVATGYMRLCQSASARGYRNFGGIPMLTTQSTEWQTRPVAQRMSDAEIVNGNTIGGLFTNHDGKRALRIDGFSDLRILRPMLAISDTGAIDFGKLPAGKAADAPARTIANAQPATARDQRTDDATPTDVPTVLYGIASFRDDGRRYIQTLTDATDHVGAILIGPDAERFAFVTEHAGETPRQLKLIGADGQGGLLGGASPESEPLVVRFLGSDKPGTYRATVRIVTQAMNLGTLSTLSEGEPPFNLHYVDIPVQAEVSP